MGQRVSGKFPSGVVKGFLLATIKKGERQMKPKQKEIVIDAFKVGDYPQGKFTAKELSEIESTYNPENYEAPILIGHLSDPAYTGKSTIPAYGWIGKVKIVGDHLKLVASQFSEQLKEFIKDGFYKKVSAAFFKPEDPNNPTPGKWHLHHLAFLGGAAPAVKGLEQIAFAELRGLGIEFAETETMMEVDGEVVEQVKNMGNEDSLKDMAEYCGNYLKKVEDAFSADIDDETRKGRINLAAYDLQSELAQCVNEHFAFMDKMSGMKDKEMEMSEKKSWLVQMAEKVQSIIHNRKETEMDQVKEQEYQAKILKLETENKEFTEQKRIADEAKAKADADAKTAAAKIAEEKLTGEIKTFCEEKVKEGKMTPAMREKDEPIMITLAKTSSDALKAFQEKYTATVVPLGETPGAGAGDGKKPDESKLGKATQYVKDHPKEFVGLEHGLAVARAVYLEANAQIKF